jgi:hypothetical protein
MASIIRFSALSWIACMACSAGHFVESPDPGASAADPGPVENDAVADGGVDAPSQADCFAGEIVLATSTSRLAVDPIVPVKEGWLVGADSTSTGSGLVLVDRDGRVSSRQPFSFGPGHVLPMGGSFARVTPNAVGRIDRVDGKLSSGHTDWRVGWGSILGANVEPSGTLRAVWYDPEGNVSDLRIRVTDFTLDDGEPTGFATRDGTLPPGLTERLGRRFDYLSYFVRGDMLRIVGPTREDGVEYESLLVALDTRTLGTGEPLGFSIDEEATWNEAAFVFGFAGVTNEWDRMLVQRRALASESFEARAEPLPGRVSSSGALTGSLGIGSPFALESVIAIADQHEVRLVDAADLSPRGNIAFEGTFTGVAQSGDAVAVLVTRMEPGEMSLRVRCLAIAP